ncbi:SGNH/GDSL hydrolase family protein [Nocardioides conyzicola]|uniref:GDSL-type esterase/lipase family protein n=1 Tax=Nocardioides conyzicola TaxID=1651781 RepID=A0ABP8WNL4_9ACTN
MSDQSGLPQLVEPTRILITGDSITQGTSGDYTWRYHLWNKLVELDLPVAFVGPRSDLYDFESGEFGSATYAQAFGGQSHGAKWGSSLLLDGPEITEQVESSMPDVLVEVLGSNDLACLATPGETVERLLTYIDRARAARPGIGIVVGTVTTRYDVQLERYTLESESTEYRALLSQLAAQLDTSGARIVVADISTGFDPRTMTWDGTHPNEAGERVIAQRIFEALGGLGIGPVDTHAR